MRKLITSTFVSLDGVMQAPGGPEEDPTGGFALGGWSFAYWDETMDAGAAGFDSHDRELVLGRRTYEIFAAYWPYQPEGDPTAASLNAARKHVASRTLESLDWNNSTLLQGDVVAAITALKSKAGPDLQVIGSGGLIQALQAASLIDEYHVWTFPVVLGRGKRLFEATAKPSALRLVDSKVSGTGVVMSTYVPNGEIQPGSFASIEPSARELERRSKWAGEGG
jgi:dihydrofolate reductase